MNVHSRVLMYLFKARQKAQQEYEALRQASGRSQQDLEELAHRRGYARSLFYPAHTVAGTASNVLVAIDPCLGVRVARRPAAPDTNRPRAAAIGHSRVAFRDGAIPLTPVTSSLQGVHRPG